MYGTVMSVMYSSVCACMYGTVMCSNGVSSPDAWIFFYVPDLFQIISSRAMVLLTIHLYSIHVPLFQGEEVVTKREHNVVCQFSVGILGNLLFCSIGNVCLFKQQSPPVKPVICLIIHFNENWTFWVECSSTYQASESATTDARASNKNSKME